MHDVTSEHWHEPKGFKNAGYGAWKRPNTPYDDFMEAQGIPIYPRHRRAARAGHAAEALERAWAATAPSSSSSAPKANGAATWSRCRARGALNPERHMYEEIMVVVEGRGTTEIWTDGQKKPHSFEWQTRLDVLGRRSTPGTASSTRRRARRSSSSRRPRRT